MRTANPGQSLADLALDALSRHARGLAPDVQTRDLESQVAPVDDGGVCRDASRVMVAGGNLVAQLLPTAYQPFEQLYRKIPPPAVYLNPTRDAPVFFELGAFYVPTHQALIIADYEFSAYRVGPSASDPIPLEPERLSASLGWTLGGRSGASLNTLLQLVATPAQSPQQQFNNQNTLTQGIQSLAVPFAPLAGVSLGSLGLTGAPAGLQLQFGSPQSQNPTTFNQSQAMVTSPQPATPVLPQSRGRVGARDMPFALYATSSDAVQLGAVAFAPITTPLAYVQGSVRGFLLNESTLNSLLQGVRPCA